MDTNIRFKMAAALGAKLKLEQAAKELDTAQQIIDETLPEMTNRLVEIRALIEDLKEDLQERFVDSVK